MLYCATNPSNTGQILGSKFEVLDTDMKMEIAKYKGDVYVVVTNSVTVYADGKKYTVGMLPPLGQAISRVCFEGTAYTLKSPEGVIPAAGDLAYSDSELEAYFEGDGNPSFSVWRSTAKEKRLGIFFEYKSIATKAFLKELLNKQELTEADEHGDERDFIQVLVGLKKI